MNNETKELIEQLAAKLGTTTEYLWSVLIKQAPIFAASTILEIVGVIIMGVALWRTHKKLSAQKEGNYNFYENHDLAIIPMSIAALIWAVLFIAAFFAFSHVITAIANPEYWALMEILDRL